MMKTTIALMDRDTVVSQWGEILPVLMTAEDYWGDFYSPADILHMILSGSMHLFAIHADDKSLRCIMIVQWLNYPQGKTLAFEIFAALELDDYVAKIIEAIEPWGLENGAERFQVSGRPAWKTLLVEHGYKLKAVTMSKIVGD